MYEQGDIVLTQFPFTDLTGSKLRPALILSCNSLHSLGDYVCVQITSKLFDDGYFVPLTNEHLDSPLPLKSGIRLQKIFTLNNSIIVSKMAQMTAKGFDKIILSINSKVLGSK